ncbi:MAG: hypothetical protein WA615_13815, partial [Bradyrhizobium sp.]|uniref:hypothetical protein n=1 Tax=Bradyrhizobium sp. TaxID=376 RepID=UPI003C7DCBA5
ANRRPEKIPTVIDRASETGRKAIFKIKKSKKVWRIVMPSSRDEFKRAHARLLTETPISEDPTLFPLQEEVADLICEAKRRDPSEPDLVDGLAHNYFDHIIRTRHRRRQKG